MQGPAKNRLLQVSNSKKQKEDDNNECCITTILLYTNYPLSVSHSLYPVFLLYVKMTHVFHTNKEGEKSGSIVS